MSTNEKIVDLSRYRINKAKENYEAANVLFESGYYSESINRSYYAIFNTVFISITLKPTK